MHERRERTSLKGVFDKSVNLWQHFNVILTT